MFPVVLFINFLISMLSEMNQNKVEGQSGAVESDQDESCSESTESNSMDTNMLRSKFASLAATLQQTNQNLVKNQ